MITFDVTTDRGFIVRRPIVAGNTERCRFNFQEILGSAVLTAVTASVTSDVSTVDTPVLSDNKKSAYLHVTTTELDETFTLAVRITTSDGQTLHFTVVFDVGTPVVVTRGGTLPLLYGPTGATGPSGGLNTPSAIGTGVKTVSNAADSSTNFGHYISVDIGGTTYYIPCSSVAPS